MTSGKTKADEEGWKRGAGAYSKEVKLNRGFFPNSVPGTDPRGVGKYTSDDSGLTLTKVDPERLTNDAAIDIYDEVWDQNPDDSNRAIKSRGGQS
jgi:hypothetical protein